jgi:hypothetical protein
MFLTSSWRSGASTPQRTATYNVRNLETFIITLYKQRCEQNPNFLLIIIIRSSTRFNFDRFCKYVLQ